MDTSIYMASIHPEWKKFLNSGLAKPHLEDVMEKVRRAYLEDVVFPEPQNVFRAFDFCRTKDVRVVILGQDPYHTPGVADGLAFSSFEKNPVPPSLKNIYKEIASEFGAPLRTNPDLGDWAKQGVLLINSLLTVESGKANSHVSFGWHEFTDEVIRV